MNPDFLVQAPSADSHENVEASGSAQASSGLSRRKFLKRSGGATVATLVAATLVGTRANAEGEGEGSSWGMRCISPDWEDTTKNFTSQPISIPQAGGGNVPMTITWTFTTSKAADPAWTKPYGSCNVSGTGEINIYSGGSLKTFKGYWVEHAIACDEATGNITGSFTRNWATRSFFVTIGTTQVEFGLISVPPIQVGVPQPNGKSSLLAITAFVTQFRYTHPVSGATYNSLPTEQGLVNEFIPVEN